MTLTELPGTIVTPTRDREIERFKRAFRLRVPNADTDKGSQVDIDSKLCGDMLMPLYAAAKINGENAVMENARGKALKQWGEREGVDGPLDARGASGAITIQASAGGGTILAGTEIKKGSIRYEVVSTAHYNNGDPCSVTGKDTGPTTNQDVGTQLQWTSAPPGIGDFALVRADSNGRGLSGGADKETDEEYLARIEQEKRNRAASGNDSQYQEAAEATPNAGIKKAFSYPAVSGSHTTCVVCIINPEHPGGSRAPSSTTMALVEAHVIGQMPADDGSEFGLIANENADLVLEIAWSESAADWEDIDQWPPYYEVSPASGPGSIRITSASSSTAFTLATANGTYSGVKQPKAGQTIGFYDRLNFTFRRKRILSVTGTGPWVIACDASNNASDTSYTPEINQRAMPWSDSLDSILYTAGQEADGTQEAVPASGVLAYMDTLGPGEQVATFYDEGNRQRRMPRPPKSWPMTITRRGLLGMITAAEVEDVDLVEGDGLTPTVGTPGVLSNLLLLRWLSVFPAS